mmetsp:Transcript_17104/g.28841  ORF Transcript_17104/g.28841 Transcript_17104/m.28841 type:complete len:242 (+) Transcript_17104:339-1064(+)
MRFVSCCCALSASLSATNCASTLSIKSEFDLFSRLSDDPGGWSGGSSFFSPLPASSSLIASLVLLLASPNPLTAFALTPLPSAPVVVVIILAFVVVSFFSIVAFSAQRNMWQTLSITSWYSAVPFPFLAAERLVCSTRSSDTHSIMSFMARFWQERLETVTFIGPNVSLAFSSFAMSSQTCAIRPCRTANGFNLAHASSSASSLSLPNSKYHVVCLPPFLFLLSSPRASTFVHSVDSRSFS